jgi:hypothetical protein
MGITNLDSLTLSGSLVVGGNAVPASAVITVGAESTNVRAITIAMKDGTGAAMTTRALVNVVVLADANGDAFATTGGSTGIAIGSAGALLALVAKKAFMLITEADGTADLTYTDTGSEACYLGVVLPTGELVISAAMTNT